LTISRAKQISLPWQRPAKKEKKVAVKNTATQKAVAKKVAKGKK